MDDNGGMKQFHTDLVLLEPRGSKDLLLRRDEKHLFIRPARYNINGRYRTYLGKDEPCGQERKRFGVSGCQKRRACRPHRASCIRSSTVLVHA